uniref:ATP synthase subunit a n=1 Tax=Elaphrothrips spiniceps TaxID=3003602 RepID=A0AA50LUR3_9NEOP|nr:ATP synthase F0 subunit 6 [Elaphrothrips spiniceps]
MEMGLFSSFDPYCGMFMPMNFFILSYLFFSPLMYWYFLSRYYFFIFLELFLNKEFILLISKKMSSSYFFYIGLFMFMFQLNFFGMFPFVFSMTSQLSFNLFWGFIFFLVFFIMGWFKMSMKMFSHLTPMSSPLILSPLLVLIELISSIIRPFTLSIRLTANIVSGHIMLDIILSPSEKMFFFFCIAYFFFVLPIFLLELMVCFVQAYVISSLSSLYLGEPLSH